MPAKYGQHFNTRETPQSEAIPGKDMARNNAGGFGFAVDDWTRLDRFLILGSEGGTYYVKEAALTKANASAVLKCIQEDGPRVVRRIVEISDGGRAPKNDSALFALAMASALGNEAARKSAYAALPKVARIGTHLFAFMEYRKAFGGRGQGFHKAIQRWYFDKGPEAAAFQMAKYQQRNGWSHRDVLRLVRPKPTSEEWSNLFAWGARKYSDHAKLPQVVRGMVQAPQHEPTPKDKWIKNFGLQREMLPTEWLNDPSVWEALLENMPMTALVRNLGNLSKCGLLKPMSEAEKRVIAQLADVERLQKSRLHPLSILVAARTYASGHGMRGHGEWIVCENVVDALDEAFYKAFKNVEPTNKRTMLALDVSGSMGFYNIAGMPITPREASAALALVTVRTEPQTHTMAFASSDSSARRGFGRPYESDLEGFRQVSISKRSTITSAIKSISGLPFGGTDCALPMLYALKHNLPIDVFTVYTDSETWAGDIHPVQALEKYRQKTGIPAKLIVVGMTSNGFSIADPNDGGMLDVVGFDTAVPQVMRDFVVGPSK